jgi:hypothetical protein
VTLAARALIVLSLLIPLALIYVPEQTATRTLGEMSRPFPAPVSSGHGVTVGYYQPANDCKTTVCVDTYGVVVIYEGSPRKRIAMTPETFSVCVEGGREADQIARAMDSVGAIRRYGALAP